MSKTNAGLDDLDITNEELSRFTKAFKNDEFKKLFSDYCEEINDPENRRIYESELKQLESERGIDLTFLHPQPGYVLKTTTNGDLKTFINVATCDKIGKPSSKCGVNSSGDKGLDWSLPYAQSSARRDYDKNGKLCAVYDVVFHPDTIHLAHKNSAFKKLVSSTALDAVAVANNVTLDIVNVKSPNIKFKGTARPTVIRKKTAHSPGLETSPIDHIFPPLLEDTRANKVAKDIRNETTKYSIAQEYTTPKHTLCQRKNVEYSEMTNELDAKLNSTIPSELVVTVDLPLIRNINDTTLDVTSDELYLVSDFPAKYKLKLKLPYSVDQTKGAAKFDSSKRSLVVTLPVQRKSLTIDDITNGNQTSMDTHSSVEESPQSPLIQEILQTNMPDGTSITHAVLDGNSSPTFNVENTSFLDATIKYEFPTFICETFSNIITFKLDVKNIDPISITLDQKQQHVHLKFMSIGMGFFPQYYAFYVQLPDQIGSILFAQPDVWDNHLILQIKVANLPLSSYKAGVDAEHISSFEAPSVLHQKDIMESIPLENLTLHSTADKKDAQKSNDKRRSYSESNCDDYKENLKETVEKSPMSIKSPIKMRTYSECSSIDEHGEPQKCLKGILKRRSSSVWSISESSFDENVISKSVDFPENSIPEEHMEHCKKSVRFDNNIRKFLFRTNSTIVGQRKPKTNKRKKKKRTTERRYSEGEASDYDPKHSSSEGECNGHTSVGTKSLRSDAMHDSGVDLSDQVFPASKRNAKHEVNLKFKSDMIFDIDM